jgi:hypothetical protein
MERDDLPSQARAMTVSGEMPPAVAAAAAKLGTRRAAEISALCEAIAPVIRDVIAAAIKPISERNAALEVRVQELEAKPSMKYRKVWDQAKVYGSGNFVTDGGSMWHADRANVGERPGSSDAWTLAVKKGRDAR